MIRGLLTVDPNHRLTLNQLLRHPWLVQYRVPPKVPPLTGLEPFASADYENSVKFGTMSILGTTPSFTLDAIPKPVPNVDLPPREESNVLMFRDETTGIESTIGCLKGKIEIDERVRDPIRHLAMDDTSNLPQFHKRDRPDDPNTGAIVTVYPHWRPPPYHPAYWYPTQVGAAYAPYYWIAQPPPRQQQYWEQEQMSEPPAYIVHEASSSLAEVNATRPSTKATEMRLPEGDIEHYDMPPPSATGYRDDQRASKREAVRAAETVFKFDELLDLQIYIMRKFQWAYIALRRSPNIGK